MLRSYLFALLLASSSLPAALAQKAASKAPASGPGYHLLAPIPLGGEGGWDYVHVDSKARRLYASHGTKVEVVNLDTRQKVGTIANTPGVHGIEVAAGRGFVSCGLNNTVLLFDPQTLKKTGSVPTGSRPDALLYDAFSNRLFVFNNGATTATVIDAKTAKVVGTAELGGAPEAGVSDGHGTIFVNLEDKSEIAAVDAKTLKVKHRWSVAPGEEPSGLGLDEARHRLYTVCGNKKMVVLDSRTGQRLAELPIGEGTDGAVFDPGTGLAISSNGEGSLTVVKEAKPGQFRVLQTATTERGARTLALDPKTHHLYSLTADYGATPAPTTGNPHPRPAIVPGTFRVLELAPASAPSAK